MLTILVTGRMASGKSSFLSFFRAKNLPVFQADEEVHKLLRPDSPCYESLKQNFGLVSSPNNKAIDRKELAKIFFQNSSKSKEIEDILHPYVRQALEDFIKEKQGHANLVFCEIPPLPNLDMQRFSKVILIQASLELMEARLLKQGFTKEDMHQRLARQKSNETLQTLADFVVSNQGSLGDLEQQAEKILQELQDQTARQG